MGIFGLALDRAAALGVGVATLAFGNLGPGVGSTIVGLAGLVKTVRARSDRMGPECDRVRGQIQDQLLDSYSRLIGGSDGAWQADADLTAADQALRDGLGACFVDLKNLSAAAVSPQGFAGKAAELVMAGLAEQRPELFGAGAEQGLAYRFATDVVRTSIAAAARNSAYYRSLEPALTFEIAKAVGQIRQSVDAIEDEQARQGAVQDEILDRLTDLLGTQQKRDALIDRQQHELQATRADLLGLLQGVLDQRVPADQVEPALGQAFEQLKLNRAELDRLRSLANEVPDIETDLAEARAALNQDMVVDLDRAQTALRRARLGYRKAVEKRRAQEAMNLSRMFEAEAELAAARFRFEEAADLYAEAATELPDSEAHRAGALWNSRGQVCLLRGQIFPGLQAFEDAEAAFRRALSSYDRETAPRDWGVNQNNLGNSLQLRGKRIGGVAGRQALADAVDAYGKALEVLTRHGNPSEWASAQTNLGLAKQMLSAFSGGAKNAAVLEEAIAAHRLALDVRKMQADEVLLVPTLLHLGTALTDLAQLRGPEAGAPAIDEAVAVLRSALDVLNRETDPDDWALAQSSLGLALRVLSARMPGRDGEALMVEAIGAFRFALEVRTRDLQPVGWAELQGNLGHSLRLLGVAKGGAEGLEALREAIAIHRSVLELLSKESMPTRWAFSQFDLAKALHSLGQLVPAEEALQIFLEAAAAYQLGLEGWVEAETPAVQARTIGELGTLLMTISQSCSGPARLSLLRNAVENLRKALLLPEEDASEAERAAIQENLGRALFSLGNASGVERGLEEMQEALAAFRAALKTRSKTDMPKEWAETKTSLGTMLIVLGLLEEDRARVRQGVQAIDESIEIFADTALAERVEYAKNVRTSGQQFLERTASNPDR
ncbi:MAG: hypothetical protein AAF414_17945 [Pseudomonadota bacterium]